MIYDLSDEKQADVKEVGGKAFNLTQMISSGLNVPGGFVLGVSYFYSWFEILKKSSAWREFLKAGEKELETACNNLKSKVYRLTFDQKRKELLSQFLSGYDDSSLFAVRSSSPEEDLSGASFAGAYESALGVTGEDLEPAVKRVFSSCLDVRITLYKKSLGFPIDQPKIAVIVQNQIASDKAGVGFSINPITNDYDEIVINANWGQGETVVSGLATPDSFIVQKGSMEIVERTLGTKETSMFLDDDGGTYEKPAGNSGSFCVSDTELTGLAEQVKKVEDHYGQPMDIEWAVEGSGMYLVQARPITTHHQLEDRLVTNPGAPRRLYLDMTMSVQGIFEPMSPLGFSTLRTFADRIKFTLFGLRAQAEINDSLAIFSGGRIYINVPNMTKLMGAGRISNILGQMDPLVQGVYNSMDIDKFATGNVGKLNLILAAVPRCYGIALRILKNFHNPEEARDRWHKQWLIFKKDLEDLKGRDLPFEFYLDEIMKRLVRFLCWETITVFPCAKIAKILVTRLFPDPGSETEKHLERLEQGLPGNLTVEMGLALYDLHFTLRGSDIADAAILAEKLNEGSLPPEFIEGWKNLLERFGHRGPMEIDLAAPRFRDEPSMLLQQITGFLARDESQGSPVALYRSNQAEREESFKVLGEQLSKRNLGRFQQYYKVIETLGGFRETHKFVLVYAFDQLRQRMLKEAGDLAGKGRLENEQDIFYLTLDQVTHGLDTEEYDLLAGIADNSRNDAADRRCKQLTPLIDSRGRFYKPEPREIRDGEVPGQAVSPGIASGPVKVLSSPGEKPIEPGDILVARATDPAWTPLFVNAAAIILEVGGPLQHGALVAREYGKPCVSSVLNATQLFNDGEHVRVDGDSGIISRKTDD